MYLSNRDIKWAIDCGKLIVDPRPEACEPPKGYDETGIDLHWGPSTPQRSGISPRCPRAMPPGEPLG
jgi:hypothetical protein